MWEEEFGGSVKTKNNTNFKKPAQYRVVMHNDDYSTMDFVVEILMSVFSKSISEATKIMLDVHQKGAGQCGIFSKEIAETKIETVHERARKAGYPLRCSMEKA